jgi:hypothetical protein
MLTIISPISFVWISFFVFNCSFSMFHAFMPLSMILAMSSNLSTFSLLITELKIPNILIFFHVRLLAWLRMFFLFD